jgi:TnpA family transposase
MPRRVTLTDRQREALLHLPVDQGELLRHYTLSDEDLGHIRQRRRAHNRFGFALQLCVLRYPGRVLAPGELIPAQVSDFIAAQLGLTSDDLLLYAAREETRHEHLADLRRIYGYRSFSGRGARDLREWMASPQALYAEQRFSGHNVNIGVRQRREGTGRGFRG